MEVDLSGQRSLVRGTGPVAAAVAERLAAAGAVEAEAGAAGALDLYVDVSIDGPSGDARAVLAQARKAAERMAADGRIVFVTGLDAVLAASGRAEQAAAAAGVASAARALAIELGPKGIRVNAVAAGPEEERFVSHVPAGRSLGAEDVAAGVLFLASPVNGYMTGHVLVVDGGLTAGFARDF